MVKAGREPAFLIANCLAGDGPARMIRGSGCDNLASRDGDLKSLFPTKIASVLQALGVLMTESTRTAPRLLFVDDEPSIRLTLPAILKRRGFDVTAAATVSEALNFIATQKFDFLLSDLNIGEPGDGFTVVSAMRRTQPEAGTFILTGYPAFETALEAIRQQVDDYFVKPADVDTLVQKIQEKLATPRNGKRRIEIKRLTTILNESKRQIVSQWLKMARADEQINSTRRSDAELIDHLPSVIDEMMRDRESQRLSPQGLLAAQKHGTERFRQGCTIPTMIRESGILHEVVSRVVQENLLAVEISFVIADIMSIGETIQAFLEESMRAYLHARHALTEAAQPAKGKSVLLLISANRELSLLRAYALQRAGYSISRADSRQDALGLLNQQFDALIISYSVAPEMIVEMTELFRERNPNSPVIGVTQQSWQDLKIAADYTITGEEGPEALLETVETALNRKQLRLVK